MRAKIFDCIPYLTSMNLESDKLAAARNSWSGYFFWLLHTAMSKGAYCANRLLPVTKETYCLFVKSLRYWKRNWEFQDNFLELFHFYATREHKPVTISFSVIDLMYSASASSAVAPPARAISSSAVNSSAPPCQQSINSARKRARNNIFVVWCCPELGHALPIKLCDQTSAPNTAKLFRFL